MTAEFLGSNANQMTEKIGLLMELSILAVRNSESVPRWRTTSLSRPNYICLSNCGKLGMKKAACINNPIKRVNEVT